MGKKVAPSILSADFARLGSEIQAVVDAGADWIHVDVMDGHFVPNITIGPPVVKSIRKVTDVPLDVHLMIERPEKYIKDFAEAGSNNITIHVESTQDPAAVLKEIKNLGCRPGITLKPETPIEKITDFFPLVDLVLIMTVNPGFSGQAFMPKQAEKIREVRKSLDKIRSKALIEVDGGITAETAKQCIHADVFVAGNYIFKNNYEQMIRSLKELT
ncbi:MAG: ribulose-phosphate 3-epimerase [Proteobacteria bacterium SG_bin7]|nr:MAG: ribulose-phosphate 3-epimerase [Proteobacteria bacterium SG_bin7]